MTKSHLRGLSAGLMVFFVASMAWADRSAAADSGEDNDRSDRESRVEWHQHGGEDHGNDLVSIGHDATLQNGQRVHAIVSILGSATNEGDAAEVVSVLGETRSTGSVRNDAVAVLGDAYIDGKVGGDVVAVMGNLELGPHADIDGDVTTILGSIRRDPAATVHGSVQHVFGGDMGGASWLRAWVTHCLLYGRPLAWAPGLGWAWGLALGFLAFYACLALMCRSAISECVRTMETQPGQTLLASIIAMLLTPVLVVLLCVTVIGIAAVPFIVAALLCAGLFGKAVMLAWVGGRVTGRQSSGPLSHPAVAVLVGGVLVLACYMVPVLGFLIYKLLGILGFGAVVYTLILAVRARRAANTASPRTGAAPLDSAAPLGDSSPPGGNSASRSAAPPPSPSVSPEILATLPHAGFWIRMAALLLDIVLIGIATSMLHGVGHLHLILLAAYGAIMWKLRGSTVGGIVFDLRVVRVDGREVEWETAIVRALGCFLSLAIVGLGFIWIVFDDANQAWHDKIAGTVVVRMPKAVAASTT